MNSQVYKDEVQPEGKTPTDVEKTKGAYEDPLQHKKSKAHVVLFNIAIVCVVVGLLSLMIGSSLPTDVSDYEGRLVIAFTLNLILPMFAFVSGVVMFLIGLIAYFGNRESR